MKRKKLDTLSELTRISVRTSEMLQDLKIQNKSNINVLSELKNALDRIYEKL